MDVGVGFPPDSPQLRLLERTAHRFDRQCRAVSHRRAIDIGRFERDQGVADTIGMKAARPGARRDLHDR